MNERCRKAKIACSEMADLYYRAMTSMLTGGRDHEKARMCREIAVRYESSLDALMACLSCPPSTPTVESERDSTAEYKEMLNKEIRFLTAFTDQPGGVLLDSFGSQTSGW